MIIQNRKVGLYSASSKSDRSNIYFMLLSDFSIHTIEQTMPYLIDGNNLMPVLGIARRKELLEEVSKFAQVKKVKVTVVFDGAEEDFFPDGSSYKGVKIFYARQNSDADTRIKNLVENSKEKRTMIVVTNDRALGDYCRRISAKVFSSKGFREKLSEVKSQAINQTRQQGVKPDEIDDWLKYFGIAEK